MQAADELLRPEELLHPEQRVWSVKQWKYGIDTRSPWWQKFYFRCIYLPFQRFSYKRMKMPAVKEVTIEAAKDGTTKTIFRWFEDGGVFESEHQADLACLTEFDGYKQLPFNRTMPRDSAQYGGTIFPRAKNPRREAHPAFDLAITSRKGQQALLDLIARLRQRHEQEQPHGQEQ